MQLKLFLFIILLVPNFWVLSQNPEIDEFNSHIDSSYFNTESYSALKHAFKALNIASELENDSLRASAFVSISYCYLKTGNLTSALAYALKAKPIYEIMNSTIGSAVLYIQIARIYSELENYALAIQYNTKALHLSVNERLLQRPILINLGEIYRVREAYDSALVYFEKAQSIPAKNDSIITFGYINCNSGLVYAALGEQKKSDSLITVGLKILKQHGDYRPIAETYYELAKISVKNGDLINGAENAKKSFNIASENNLTVDLKRVSLLLSEINSKTQNYQNAYRYLIDYNNYNKSFTGDSVVSKIAEMRAEFEISQNEAELTYHKKLGVARTRLLYVALVGAFIISLLAFYALIQSRRRKEANFKLSEFNEELSLKNEVISQQSSDKDILMKEIHHRVKNNLQIISSIMNLQSMRIDNKQTLEIFEEMQRRIMAISVIHQKLYQSESISVINVKEYLGEIVEAIHNAFNNSELNVGYEIAVQNIDLSVDIAVALGLIVNELATNAYKYAFEPNKENILVLALSRNTDSKIDISIQDNGPGMPESFDFNKAESLGLRMVNLLVRQQKGIIKVVNDEGTRFEISINAGE